MEELRRLSALQCATDRFLIAEEGGGAADFCQRVYRLRQINRKERGFALHFAALFAKTLKIMLKERPSAVVSTGALAAFPALLIGKLTGAKVVYVESFARTSSLSLTGKLAYRFADLFIVQWPELQQLFPKSIYGGSLFGAGLADSQAGRQ